MKDSGGKRTSRVLVDKLTQPNGVAFKDGSLYVMAIDKVAALRRHRGEPERAAGRHHRRLQPAARSSTTTGSSSRFGPDDKLYVPFGAPCNICDPPPEYAQIRRYNVDGSGMEVIARGVRNSVGFDWHPKTKELWFTDNGRDWVDDDGPEDELNRVTKVGDFYGFPYCHAMGIPDPDVKKPNAVQRRDDAGDAHGLARRRARHALLHGLDVPGGVSATACSSRATARGTARS